MSERKIHVGGVIWTYRIGRGSIVIRDPQRRSTVINFRTLLGREDNNDIDYITPANVRAYIEQLPERK